MNRRSQAVLEMQDRLGHVFADQALLERALTHASAAAGTRRLTDNERLEFLGDRVLGLIIAEALGEREGQASVGVLSTRLHGLVSGEACSRAARSIGLGEAVRLPAGETRRGAREQARILGDACEALIAALYLELGLDGARPIILQLWAPLLAEPHDRAASDPKTELQEWAAATGRGPPVYRILERSGPAHLPTFTVELRVPGERPETASAGALRAAEKAAALALLRRVRTPE
ncbi:MAG TPA: ribonuclease III [Caulobacteraceae bacterium]|jgi:ribonuclease-3